MLATMDDGLATLLVAAVSTGVAIVAAFVAIQSKSIARESVDTARRQIALAAVPYLVVEKLTPKDDMTMRVLVRNTGTVPAAGIRAVAMGAHERFMPLSDTATESGRSPTLAPGAAIEAKVPIRTLKNSDERDRTKPMTASEIITGRPDWSYVHLVLVLDYYGPHGGHVEQSFEWATNGHHLPRLRKLTIDPKDGGAPIKVEIPE